MRRHQIGCVVVAQTVWDEWTVEHPALRMNGIKSEPVALLLAACLNTMTREQIASARITATGNLQKEAA